MAIRPFIHSLHTDYRAPENADVSGGKKRDHVYARPPLHISATPHARCEIKIGTGGHGLSVKDCFDYPGAVPSSPVLLGRLEATAVNRTEEYRQCRRATGFFGWQRGCALVCAALVGAAIGSAIVAAALAPTLVRAGAETAKLFLRVSPLPRIVLGALVGLFVCIETFSYHQASCKFAKLHELSGCMDHLLQVQRGAQGDIANSPEVARGLALAREYQGEDDWVLARASEELLHEASLRGYAPVVLPQMAQAA